MGVAEAEPVAKPETVVVSTAAETRASRPSRRLSLAKNKKKSDIAEQLMEEEENESQRISGARGRAFSVDLKPKSAAPPASAPFDTPVDIPAVFAVSTIFAIPQVGEKLQFQHLLLPEGEAPQIVVRAKGIRKENR